MINNYDSKYYLMIIHNLYNTAIFHKKHCSENCNVSLTRIEWAARELSKNLTAEDLKEVNNLQWPF